MVDLEIAPSLYHAQKNNRKGSGRGNQVDDFMRFFAPYKMAK